MNDHPLHFVAQLTAEGRLVLAWSENGVDTSGRVVSRDCRLSLDEGQTECIKLVLGGGWHAAKTP